MDIAIASGQHDTGGEMAHRDPPASLPPSVRNLRMETEVPLAVSRRDWVSFVRELPLITACMILPLLRRSSSARVQPSSSRCHKSRTASRRLPRLPASPAGVRDSLRSACFHRLCFVCSATFPNC